MKGLGNQNDSFAIVFTSSVSLVSCLHTTSLLPHILFSVKLPHVNLSVYGCLQ